MTAPRDLLLIAGDRRMGTAARDHSWPWLREDDGTEVVVDAFWARHDLAITIREGDPGPVWRRHGAVAQLHGVTIIAIDLSWLRDLRGAEGAAGILGSPDSWYKLYDVGAQVLAGELFSGVVISEPDDDSEMPEGEWARTELEERELDPPRPFDVAELGWRAESMTLAALGAAAFARRVFPGGSFDDRAVDLQVLIAYTLVGGYGAASIAEVASMLALGEWDVQRAELALEADGLLTGVRRPDVEWWPPAVTAAGRARVTDWLAGIVASFEGWPPDTPGLDDVIG